MAYTTDDLFGDNLLGDPNDLDNLVEFRDDNNSDGEVAGDRNRGNFCMPIQFYLNCV